MFFSHKDLRGYRTKPSSDENQLRPANCNLTHSYKGELSLSKFYGLKN